ncbi:hypothetical protein PENTCL1PPCAC_10076, partial [Pristionchus entomophagus]
NLQHLQRLQPPPRLRPCASRCGRGAARSVGCGSCSRRRAHAVRCDDCDRCRAAKRELAEARGGESCGGRSCSSCDRSSICSRGLGRHLSSCCRGCCSGCGR